MPNALLIARYCKLFGLSPAEEVLGSPLKMAINLGCYIAYAESENEEYQKSVEKGGNEALAMGKLLEEIKEASTSRG